MLDLDVRICSKFSSRLILRPRLCVGELVHSRSFAVSFEYGGYIVTRDRVWRSCMQNPRLCQARPGDGSERAAAGALERL